jgi:ferredoxin-NADP reductase
MQRLLEQPGYRLYAADSPEARALLGEQASTPPTSSGLLEAVANALVGLGHEPARIRTERFGPTGEG